MYLADQHFSKRCHWAISTCVGSWNTSKAKNLICLNILNLVSYWKLFKIVSFIVKLYQKSDPTSVTILKLKTKKKLFQNTKTVNEILRRRKWKISLSVHIGTRYNLKLILKKFALKANSTNFRWQKYFLIVE